MSVAIRGKPFAMPGTPAVVCYQHCVDAEPVAVLLPLESILKVVHLASLAWAWPLTAVAVNL